MNLREHYPENVAKILEENDFSETNTSVLRNYFLNPDRFNMNKKTIVFSTPLTLGGL